MNKAKLIWAPYPFKAGFCITDDTDSATFEHVKLVYDFLKSIKLYTTKTVWAFKPREKCGIPGLGDTYSRGITLEDEKYFNYCKELYDSGFEISLHGASGGNNSRNYTKDAVNMIRNSFGHSSTYICHSKNAENIYWEEKSAPNGMLKWLLSLVTRYKSLGEIESSEYFWGDICREHIRQIRLFRTRNTNTLRINPSMPYFDQNKPFVRGWFTATKRSFVDCTTEKALHKLKKSFGLTVLYQYLHRYADLDENKVGKEFKTGAERLISDKEIWIDTTAKIMDRLRLIQRIFIVCKDKKFWIINANDVDVEDLQIALPNDFQCTSNDIEGLSLEDSTLHISRIIKNSLVRVDCNRKIVFSGRNIIKPGIKKTSSITFSHGVIHHVNLSEKDLPAGNNSVVKPGDYLLEFESCPEDKKPMSKNSTLENWRLFIHQIYIITREIIFMGRGWNYKKYYDKVKDENHYCWS